MPGNRYNRPEKTEPGYAAGDFEYEGQEKSCQTEGQSLFGFTF